MLAELYVVKGREAGKALELTPGSTVSFGRALSNDVRIRDAQVSRVHCRFECTESELKLKDTSGNGTVINDQRIKGLEVPLKDGDVVKLGMTEIRVLVETAEEAEERREAELQKPESDTGTPQLSDSTTDDAVRQTVARTLGQQKITLAEREERKKARARRADVPPPPGESPSGEGSAESTSLTALPERTPAPPTQGHLREVIPGYRIEAKLGGGGRRGTVVYRALQLSLDRPVALKCLLPHGEKSERDLARFLREAAAIARLPHPNIVTIHDAGRAGDRRYIVMELLPGGSAADRIEDQGPFPLGEALALGLDVARGLAFAHDRGIIHRSVRPANVLRDAAGVWKLVDFGLSKDVVHGGGGETSFLDAPLEAVAYLAPEQVSPGRTGGAGAPSTQSEQSTSAAADARSDVYSTGALLYHALTGKPPYWGESIGEIASLLSRGGFALEPLAAVAPDALVTIIERCLEYDPKDRYQEGSTLLHELAAAQAALVPGPRTRP